MDVTTLKIAIAAFIHDIGKFAGREILGVTVDELDRKASDFLPVYHGRYSHHHALFTAEFIERYKDMLPDEFSRPWGDGDGLVIYDVSIVACRRIRRHRKTLLSRHDVGGEFLQVAVVKSQRDDTIKATIPGKNGHGKAQDTTEVFPGLKFGPGYIEAGHMRNVNLVRS